MSDPKREHKLGCDEMHGHRAPKCCTDSCWCHEEKEMSDALDPEASAALDRWNKTSSKLTEDMRDRIDSLVSDLEYCLKFGSGRIWLGIEAKTLLASSLYGVSWFDDSKDMTKTRRKAVEHTRRQGEDHGTD